MSDPLRTNDAASDADRDAKIEQLLLAGLDHYFSGQYEHAINVWTRALFFDRNHARARAYIDRARSALAEAQRETDELLHSGLAAFARGEGPEARRLLQSAIGRGAPADEALAVLDRLDRLEVSSGLSIDAGAAAPPRQRVSLREPQKRETRGFKPGVVVAMVAALVAVAAAAFMMRNPSVRPFAANGVFDVLGLLEQSRAPIAAAPASADGTLGLPRRGEMALAHAQNLRASGHLHDALDALDAVRITDKERADADRLRSDMQRQLITRTP
ncbi:MAG TPA: hypothetical protein VHZ73_08720 [Vicinamibacterales bacterium]|jgi:hypothetical protein|nr:hypothetical protein [Vicinamibacterales bacterium]